MFFTEYGDKTPGSRSISFQAFSTSSGSSPRIVILCPEVILRVPLYFFATSAKRISNSGVTKPPGILGVIPYVLFPFRIF